MALSMDDLLVELGKEVAEKLQVFENHPKEGVEFLNLDTVYEDSYLTTGIVTHLVAAMRDTDFIIVPEARGFILGGAVAITAGVGLITLRKKGNSKLPLEMDYITAQSEYVETVYELPKIPLAGRKVTVFDDVIATGNTVSAIVAHLRNQGAEVVEVMSLITLTKFGAAQEIDDAHLKLITVLKYSSEKDN